MNQRQLFLNHLAQTSDAPLALEIQRAEGLYLYGSKGERYMDLISGISVSNVGHCHPRVVEAVKKQAETHMHLMVYGEYIQSPQVKLAKLLTDHLPASLDCCYFLNSGSEATEGALKLAKRYTGRTGLVSFRNAYHGSTQGSLSVMGSETFKNAFRPLLPDVRTLEFNNVQQLDEITGQTACVIIEPVQGEAGVRLPADEFLKALRKKCNDTGALLIFDEIQTGCGRTGKLFAFEHYNVVPDILLLAKGMGGGMPVSAFISSRKIMSSLTNDPPLGHISTFGGNPVCCAAAHATLEVLIEEKLAEQVEKKEKLFNSLLQHKAIKEVRSKGLLMAIDLESAEINFKVINECVRNGVITDWFLFCDHALRIAPPLTITESEIREACKVIIDAIDKVIHQ
jgi:acetylornithine/succinyldiaminopimelate/putrescine aminotransferase